MIVDGVVVHEYWYPHPIERVWDAVTEPAALATWLMPNDAPPAHGASFTFDGGDRFGAIVVDVIEQDPPRSLRWQWTVSGKPTEVSIRLEAEMRTRRCDSTPGPVPRRLDRVRRRLVGQARPRPRRAPRRPPTTLRNHLAQRVRTPSSVR